MRVALIGENSIGYINALIDIWNKGDCAVLIDWRIPFSTAIEMMNEADVRVCYIEKEIFDKLQTENLNNIRFITYEKQNSSAELLPNCIYEKFHENYSRNEAVVIYSSGTTGKSKGVILSHYAINTNADAIIDYIGPTKEDCFYIVKTISHASSLTGELLVSLKSRIPLVIAPIIVPPRYTLANIKKYKVTTICINPTLLQMYADEVMRNPTKYDLSSLKEIYVHGAKASTRLCKLADEVFISCSVYYEYGLTEAGPRVATQKNRSKDKFSVGQPIKNVQIMIVDDAGEILTEEEYGNIYVKTPSVYSGYVHGEPKCVSLHEGWLNTGDIGFLDKHKELHVVGRADDVLNIHAHKIYPSDVEKQIMKYAQIKECAVAKIELNSNECIGCLYVSEKEVDRSIREILKTKLLAYEIPSFFLRCDVLPRTKNGKVSMREVQACLKEYISQEKKYDDRDNKARSN